MSRLHSLFIINLEFLTPMQLQIMSSFAVWFESQQVSIMKINLYTSSSGWGPHNFFDKLYAMFKVLTKFFKITSWHYTYTNYFRKHEFLFPGSWSLTLSDPCTTSSISLCHQSHTTAFWTWPEIWPPTTSTDTQQPKLWLDSRDHQFHPPRRLSQSSSPTRWSPLSTQETTNSSGLTTWPGEREHTDRDLTSL